MRIVSRILGITAQLTVMGFMAFAPSAHAQMPHQNSSVEQHAENAVMQPLKDVNLRKDPIPEKLLAVQDDPYNLENMRGCRALQYEIDTLTYVLGPDVNQFQEEGIAEKREQGVSRVAGELIGGLIPFRGVVRELSGANAAERRYLYAISAGNARRSFLKGVAVTKGCIPPPPAFQLRLGYDYTGF